MDLEHVAPSGLGRKSADMSMPGDGGWTRSSSDPLEPRLRPLQIVYEMAATVAAASSLEVVYDQALGALTQAAGADRAAVLLCDADGVLRFEASSGLSESYRRAVEGHAPWPPAPADPAPVLVPDVEADPGLASLRPLLRAEGIHALASVPLTHRSRLLGTFMLYYDAAHRFSDDEIRIARTIASHIALAVERHRSEEALERSYGQLALALEAGGMGTWEWHIPSGTVVWSESLERLHGLAPGSFAGTWEAFQEEIVPEDREGFLRGIGDSVSTGTRFELAYRMRRPDGELRWIGARGTVVTDRTGRATRMVGVCSDITERKRHEDALAVLAKASEVLYSSLSYPQPLEELARVVVPRLADWCAVHLVHADGRVEQTTVVHADPERMALARRFWEHYPPEPAHVIFEVARSGRSALFPEITDEMVRATARDEEQGEILSRLGLRSSIIVPLTARGRALGTLTLVTAESGRHYDVHDLALVEELGRRAGLAIDNARLYEERSRVARTLQQRLLPPELPDIPGLELAARYLPAAAEVGGDFYDVFPVGPLGPAGEAGRRKWVFAMGDVCGKGVEAAALTGMIRSTLRAVAMEHGEPTAILLALNDAILPQLHDRQFFTMVAATLERVGAGAELTVACAGHVPPLLVHGDRIDQVGTPGTLLGVFAEPSVTNCSVTLAPGDALVLFTDGATNQRASEDTAGIVDAIASAGPGAASVADAVARVAELGPTGSPRDDVAVLVVRVPGAAAHAST